jgi:hypothetical protein
MIDRKIAKIKIRRGTDAQRKQVVFEEGELVFTTDQQRIFIGDGTTYGGKLASNINHIVTTSAVPSNAQKGDIVFNKNNNATYIVNSDISNNLFLTKIAQV